MQFKYFIAGISIGENMVFSVLRKKRLFDENGKEILLSDAESNYRCTLNPNSDIDSELAKISSDGAELNSELKTLIANELKETLRIWWTPERVEKQRLEFSGFPSE